MALSINECTIHLNTVRIFEGGGGENYSIFK